MPVTDETKHLGPGSECPPLKPGLLRLYSMRFCPYAERTRLVLAAKEIPHEVVNINLKQKPSWWTDKYPAGKVPTLELDAQLVPESLITCDLLDELYPQPALYPSPPWRKALDKVLVDKFDACIAPVWGMYGSKIGTEQFREMSETFNKNIQPFEEELVRRGTPFFHGDAPGMLDLMIWPWIERFPACRKLNVASLPAGTPPPPPPEIPHLHRWILRMAEHPAVKQVLISTENHLKYYHSRLGSEVPDYDMEMGA